ncbi:MAG: hypothetical protein Q7T71_18830 [Herbiconiux sp.]|nr:hypothetical protein [Herbiconiux sp.]
MPDDDDPTRITNQPSLTTSQGTVWLVVGGLMAAVSVVLLLALQRVDSSGIALIGVVAIVLLYLGMVEVRLLVRALRLRLALMAVCFGLIAAAALVVVVIIGFGASRPA